MLSPPAQGNMLHNILLYCNHWICSSTYLPSDILGRAKFPRGPVLISSCPFALAAGCCFVYLLGKTEIREEKVRAIQFIHPCHLDAITLSHIS